MRRMIGALFSRVLQIGKLVVSPEEIRAESRNPKTNRDHFVPPGHFHSPIPSVSEVQKDETRIFGSESRDIPGIDLNEDYQLKLLDELEPFYEELPYKQDREAYDELAALHEQYERAEDEAEKKAIQEKGVRLIMGRNHGSLRYFFENPNYGYADGVFLYCMIRHLKPGKIVEVGSGYSSCNMLDTNELFFDGAIECTFIDPHPQMLSALLREEDKRRVRIIDKRVQDVDIREFHALGKNDILFVDSSHVSKIGSDVNYLFFEVLPHLSKGVYIHFHDIFFPFEYPKEWVYEGRAWNESYLLRAFLQYNEHFEIALFTTFLTHFHGDRIERRMPLCMIDKGSGIWLRKR